MTTPSKTHEPLPSWLKGTKLAGEIAAAEERAQREAAAHRDLQKLEDQAAKELPLLRQARDTANEEARRLQAALDEAKRKAGEAARALMACSARIQAERGRLESLLREEEA
jgi:chromosome segregation ATPase